jgi:hypothetical protein
LNDRAVVDFFSEEKRDINKAHCNDNSARRTTISDNVDIHLMVFTGIVRPKRTWMCISPERWRDALFRIGRRRMSNVVGGFKTEETYRHDVRQIPSRASLIRRVDDTGRSPETASAACACQNDNVGRESLCLSWNKQKRSKSPSFLISSLPRESQGQEWNLHPGLGVPSPGLMSGLERRRDRNNLPVDFPRFCAWLGSPKISCGVCILARVSQVEV